MAVHPAAVTVDHWPLASSHSALERLQLPISDCWMSGWQNGRQCLLTVRVVRLHSVPIKTPKSPRPPVCISPSSTDYLPLNRPSHVAGSSDGLSRPISGCQASCHCPLAAPFFPAQLPETWGNTPNRPASVLPTCFFCHCLVAADVISAREKASSLHPNQPTEPTDRNPSDTPCHLLGLPRPTFNHIHWTLTSTLAFLCSSPSHD